MNPLDFTKPITTRDGRKVRILCTDGPDSEYPVIGIIGLMTSLAWWNLNGISSAFSPGLDLINPPVKRNVEFWVNAFEDGTFIAWDLKEKADKYYGNRIACLHFIREYTEGEGL